MTRDELNNEYFEWLYQFVCDERYTKGLSYRKLFVYFHSRSFEYSIAMDSNRAEDGVDLRYRFGYEKSYEDAVITAYLDDRPCSILEMMVALAIRCEEHIMDNPDIGNRTGQWFWDMMSNLGISSMSDEKFNRGFVEHIVSRFLNHEYERDGKGGLFRVNRCGQDLRTVEIWYQMCWYLNQVL